MGACAHPQLYVWPPTVTVRVKFLFSMHVFKTILSVLLSFGIKAKDLYLITNGSNFGGGDCCRLVASIVPWRGLSGSSHNWHVAFGLLRLSRKDCSLSNIYRFGLVVCTRSNNCFQYDTKGHLWRVLTNKEVKWSVIEWRLKEWKPPRTEYLRA